MKTLRKAVSIVLTLVMLLTLCATAFAAGTPFVDVAEDAWYYEDVMAVSAANIMLGTDTTHFSPDGSLTRAMMATILWRLDGEPKGYTCDFTDVETDGWYYEAVAWARAVGLVSGVGSNKFAPNEALTREQMAAMLYRYASRRLYIQTTVFDLSLYSDGNTVSGYAADSVRWLLSLDALHCENNLIRPKDPATRAEVAAGAALFLKGDSSLVTVVGKSAYELAVENGYTGTLTEWLASLVGETGANGADGKSAYELAVENGYEGTLTEWLASLVGAIGATGADGADGKSAYELAVENGFEGDLAAWLDSLIGEAGSDGKDGADGADGTDGKSAYELAVENGYTGTLTEWLASLVGETGADGVDGKSAYELAAENGYTGTLQEWLASLVGANGKDGADGKSAYEIAVENGYTGTEAEWLASLVGTDGKDGKDGKDGADGKSAYELAVENGYTGTAQEWLASLAGSNGNDGADGASAYELAVQNGYVGTEIEWLRSLAGKNGKSAYEIAVDHGYTGTEVEWLASLVGEAGADGKDGVNGKDGKDGIDGADGKSAYELAVENGYSGTIQEWLESLIGPSGLNGLDGKDGKDGRDGTDGKSAYELAVELGYSGDLASWLDTLRGKDGKDGADGASAYELAVANGYEGTLTQWLASLVGADGKDGVDGKNGTDGADGKSAYELAVENGYTGTVQEWLLTLVGTDGKDGSDGASAYALAVKNGYSGTEQEWLASLVGAPGADGKDGADGKSAYEIAVENGYTGTEQEWLASLVGAPGADGKDGADGADGKSAYEIAVENGFIGTEQEWLASLIGTPGADGKDGENGADGKDGADGADGKDGADGVSVVSAYVNEQTHLILVLSDGTEIDAGYVGVPVDAPTATYTVTFADHDGSVLKTQQVNAGGSATPPANPTREGYTFTGWSGSYTNVTGDTTVTALYEKNPVAETYYTVTFADYDGTVLKTQQVEAGGSATPPANPTREGYTFTGWSGSYTNVQSDVTVTAQYRQNTSATYTVTFFDYDGTTVLATKTWIPSGGYAEPPANPTKAGATFLGWSGNYAAVTSNTSVRAVYDDEKNVLMASSTGGSVGDTVTVLISLDGNVKTCAFDINIMYDPSLELVSYDDDLDLSVVVNTDEYANGILLNFSDSKDKTKQRDVIELTFKINSTTKQALPITLSVNSIKEVSGSLIIDTDYSTVTGIVLVK